MEKTRAQDEWIALRCQAGESGGFEDLIRATERPLLYYATRLTGREDAALDLLQEVWMRAFRSIRKLKDPSSVRSWLYKITHGLAVDRMRNNQTRQRAEDVHVESVPDAIEAPIIGDDAAAVHLALDELEPHHREVLVLFFLEEFSISEIAGIIGSPEGTVKSRLHYAKREIRTILVRGGYEHKS